MGAASLAHRLAPGQTCGANSPCCPREHVVGVLGSGRHVYCRRLDADKLPHRRTVIGFHFLRLHNYANWWIKVEPGRERELCFCHPGGDINVMIRANVRTLVEIWMGDTEISTALREGRMEVAGEPSLVRSLPSWLRTSKMAHVRPDSAPLRV